MILHQYIDKNADRYVSIASLASVREGFLHYMETKEAPEEWRDGNRRCLEGLGADNWHNQHEGSWTGGSTDQIIQWAREGYDDGGFASSLDLPAVRRVKTKTRHESEGDMDVESILNGEDRPFRGRVKRRRLAGIRIEVSMDFNAGVNASIIRDYAQWVNALIAGITAKGIDPEVVAIKHTDQLFRKGSGRSRNARTEIVVKEAGRISDWTAASSLFSPAGYRTLSFFAQIASAEAFSADCSMVLGYPKRDGRWNVSMDGHALKITSGMSAFPSAEMTGKLYALGIL